MQTLTSLAEIQSTAAALRSRGSLGLVPTMGALHAGHLSLVAASRSTCGATIATIFVNPTQFGPNEDYARYPRTFEADCAALTAAGVDILFAPLAAEIYPPGSATTVDPGPIATRLDGLYRPGHFRAVATIVAKLFHLVSPTHAFFGQKDAAQVAVLRAMVRDLNFPLQLIACPVVREPDGLALSSRNQYLSHDERLRAIILHRALQSAAALYDHDILSAEALTSAMLSVFAAEPAVAVEYAAVVDPATLLPVDAAVPGTLFAVAARVGQTRLIDNHIAGESHA